MALLRGDQVQASMAEDKWKSMGIREFLADALEDEVVTLSENDTGRTDTEDFLRGIEEVKALVEKLRDGYDFDECFEEFREMCKKDGWPGWLFNDNDREVVMTLQGAIEYALCILSRGNVT